MLSMLVAFQQSMNCLCNELSSKGMLVVILQIWNALHMVCTAGCVI
jgi:hypothetical protein